MESTFAANPTVDTLYVCEDGNAFIKERDAKNHSVLNGIKYEVIKRKEKEVKPTKDK